MKRIGIDCRFGAAYAGLGSYTRGLTEALTRLDAENTYVLFVRRKDEKWLAPLLARSNVEIRKANYDHYSLDEQVRFSWILKRAKLDLLLAPHFNVPYFCPVPFVCTVHDLILHKYPNEASFFKRLAYRWVFGRTVKNAKAIVTISEATKKDLIELYSTVSSKATVIYPGISSSISRASDQMMLGIRKKYGLTKPFFLYIGNCKQHKNVQMLVDAFIKANIDGFELVLITGRNCPIKNFDPRIRFIESVPEEHLAGLLSAATVCVTATKAEGFCLPLIEAMSCGTPVLATNVGPIPEVTGGHATLCKPTVESIVDGLRAVAVSTPDRGALHNFSKTYSWDASAQAHSSLLITL